MIKRTYRRCKEDKMYLICVLITLVSIIAGLLFPNAIPRLLESIKDVLVSVLYYFVNIFLGKNNPIPATVNQLQSWRIAEEIWEPIKLFPASVAEFIEFWLGYFKLVFNLENFVAYLRIYRNVFYYGAKLLLLAMPLLIYVVLKINSIKNTTCDERNKKSKQLVAFEKWYFKTSDIVVFRCKLFVEYCREHIGFVYAWALIWMLYFNVYSIVLSFIAYYLYFICSWNIFTLYVQLLKLQLDLTPVIRFIPGVIWLALFYWLYNSWCKSIADKKIEYAYQCNKAFLRKRGISTVMYGLMGSKKTLTEVSMAVTLQDMLFEDAYNTMLNFEEKFINFPWQNFRDEIDFMIDKRKIVDTISCRSWIKKWSQHYNLIRKLYTYDEYQEHVSKKYVGFIDLTFKYNYTYYPIVYNNGVKLTTLYQALEEYACAYTVFTIRTSLLFANISIRSDSVLCSNGNKPYRRSYVLSKDPMEKILNSQYAHIIDMDMIRRAKQVVEDNPKARTMLPAIYIYDEVDKERKNMNELKDVKSNTDEANQKNDGHNIGVSTIRHSNLIDYKAYVRVLGSLQRPDSLGAGTRQLGELIVITTPGEMRPVLPFFAPFWIYESLFLGIQSIWKPFYEYLEINRCDKILSVYLANNLYSLMLNHYEKMLNLYSVGKDTVMIQDGLLEDQYATDYWRHITRLEYSDVFVSDCLRGIYDPKVPNTMHIDDFECYSGIVATPEELAKQNSYFVADINKMKGM